MKQGAMQALPPLRPLCLVLKIFLQQRELNEVGFLVFYSLFPSLDMHTILQKVLLWNSCSLVLMTYLFKGVIARGSICSSVLCWRISLNGSFKLVQEICCGMIGFSWIWYANDCTMMMSCIGFSDNNVTICSSRCIRVELAHMLYLLCY